MQNPEDFQNKTSFKIRLLIKQKNLGVFFLCGLEPTIPRIVAGCNPETPAWRHSHHFCQTKLFSLRRQHKVGFFLLSKLMLLRTEGFVRTAQRKPTRWLWELQPAVTFTPWALTTLDWQVSSRSSSLKSSSVSIPIAAPMSRPSFFCRSFLCRARRSLGSISPENESQRDRRLH